jgi:hypothetical protein
MKNMFPAFQKMWSLAECEAVIIIEIPTRYESFSLMVLWDNNITDI